MNAITSHPSRGLTPISIPACCPPGSVTCPCPIPCSTQGGPLPLTRSSASGLDPCSLLWAHWHCRACFNFWTLKVYRYRDCFSGYDSRSGRLPVWGDEKGKEKGASVKFTGKVFEGRKQLCRLPHRSHVSTAASRACAVLCVAVVGHRAVPQRGLCRGHVHDRVLASAARVPHNGDVYRHARVVL